MSRPIRVVESERSPAVVSAMWKQRVLLGKNLRLLDNTRRMVVNRITLNQRITFKKFKVKLRQGKLQHARIMGNSDAEGSLRDRSDFHSTHFNTNVVDPEEDDVLRQIWNRSRLDAERSADEAGTRGTRTAAGIRMCQSAPARRSQLLSSRAKMASSPGCGSTSPVAARGLVGGPRRPDTVATTARRPLPRETTWGVVTSDDRAGQYIATGVVETTDGQDEGEGQNAKVSPRGGLREGVPSGGQPGRRSSAWASPPGGATGPGASRSPTRASTAAVSWGGAPRGHTVAPSRAIKLFDTNDNEEKITLLDIQRERIKSANYPAKVRDLCGRLEPYKIDPDYVVKDYYSDSLRKESVALRGPNALPRQRMRTPESDIIRATGNPGVRSLTLKHLDLGSLRRT